MFGVPGGTPFGALVLVFPDQFLLFRIDADHRFPGGQVRGGPGVEVGELGIPDGVLPAFEGLGVGLQAEAVGLEEFRDGLGSHTVPLCGEFGGEFGGVERVVQDGGDSGSLRRVGSARDSRAGTRCV